MTTSSKFPSKFVGLTLLSVALNLLTGVFGAIPMRTVRRVYGRLPFWLSMFVVSVAFFAAKMPAQGVFLILLTLVIGVYSEVEAHGESVFVSGLVAVLSSLGLTAVGATLWLMRSGSSLLTETKVYVAQIAKEVSTMNPDMVIDPDTLVRTMPAAIVGTLIVAVGIALIWDRVISSLFRLPPPDMTIGEKVRAFKIPDIFIWITTASIFASYYKHGNALAETVGTNVLCTMIALYFFQGVAVVGQGFRSFKVGHFWQALWTVMMILQFYAVAFLGFADFWIDFRTRFQRRQPPPDRVTENRF